MAAIALTVLPHVPQTLRCCVCGENEIPSPPGTVPSSRFFCRGCCELIWIARHIAEARDTSMEAALGIARDTIAKQSRQRWPVPNRTDSIAGAKSHSQSSAQSCEPFEAVGPTRHRRGDQIVGLDGEVDTLAWIEVVQRRRRQGQHLHINPACLHQTYAGVAEVIQPVCNLSEMQAESDVTLRRR